MLESGTELAGFRIESVIAHGETGIAYRATDVRLGREVALEVLPADRSRDPEFRERFVRESKLAASLYQPNVLPILDVGETDAILYRATRYVAGGDLGRLLEERGRLGVQLTFDIGRQIALALGAAHTERLVHRNVKPANILLGDDDRTYLAGFGFERVGTPDYAAPELLDDADDVDRRPDVYSLGAVLYRCLAGEPPSRVADPAARLMELRPDLPAAVGAIVGKAIEADRSKRYSTAPELAAALGAALAGGGETAEAPSPQHSEAPAPPPVGAAGEGRSFPAPSRRVVIVALALLVVAALLAAIFAFGSSGPAEARVPAVTSLTAAQAARQVREARLVPARRWVPSSSVAKGLVYGTRPLAGSRLPAGRTVQLLISSGPPESAVPYLVGAKLDRARQALAGAGLRVVVKGVPSGTYPAGRIAREMPGRGGSLPAGGTVTLWVSTGKPRTLVPDVRGESARQAARDLRSAGFTVRESGTYTTSNSALAGSVAGQTPVGVKAPRKTVVTLYLYVYVAPPPPPPPPVTYPPTIGVT